MTVPVPITWVTGQVVTATNMNGLRDALNFLLAPPMCEVNQGTTQSLTNGTATAITFDTEVIDTDGMHSTVTNTDRVTAQTAGRYLVEAGVSFGGNTTGYRTGWVDVNGSGVAGTQADFPPNVATVATIFGVLARQIYLNVGDYLQLIGQQGSGGALSTLVSGPARSGMSVRWVANT